MLNFLKKIIGENFKPDAQEDSGSLDADIALSALLLEAAHVDGECSDEEREQLASILIEKYGIQKDEIEKLLARGNKKRQESVDVFQFTRYMNNNFSRDEKLAFIEIVWRIILIDDHLEPHEDQFVHKLANLLRLTHKDLIDAKLKARQNLG